MCWRSSSIKCCLSLHRVALMSVLHCFSLLCSHLSNVFVFVFVLHCLWLLCSQLSNVRQYIKYGQSPRMVVNGDIRNYPQRMAIYKKFKISPFVYSLKRGIFQSIKKSQSLLCENSLFCCQRCLGLSLWCVGGALSASPNSLCELRNSCYASRTAARMEDSAAAGRRLSLVLSLAQETGKSVTKNIISRKL